MASSSSKRKGKELRMFRDDDHRKSFREIVHRKCLPGRNVDYEFIRKYFRPFLGQLGFQELDHFLGLREPYFPNLMHIFYSSITAEEDTMSIRAYVKGIEFTLTEQNLRGSLHLSVGGEDLIDQGNSSTIEGYDRLEALNLVCSKPLSFAPSRISSSHLKVEMRFLHLIVVHILYPKSGSFTDVGPFELLIMWMILQRRRINFPNLILRKLFSVVDTGKEGSLPYGMLLTQIFRSFKIPSEGEDSVKPISSDTLNEKTLSRMRYMFIGSQWVIKGKFSTKDVEEVEEDEPMDTEPSHFDPGASTSASATSMEDLLNEMRSMRSHFDQRFDDLRHHYNERFDNLDVQVANLHFDLEELKRDRPKDD